MSIYQTLYEFSHDVDADGAPPFKYRHSGLGIQGDHIESLLICQAAPWCTEIPTVRLSLPDGEDTVLLTKDQVRRIRDCLTDWLNNIAVDFDSDRELELQALEKMKKAREGNSGGT